MSQIGDDGRMLEEDMTEESLLQAVDLDGEFVETETTATTISEREKNAAPEDITTAPNTTTTTTVLREEPPLTIESIQLDQIKRSLPRGISIARVIELLAGGKQTLGGLRKDGSENPQTTGSLANNQTLAIGATTGVDRPAVNSTVQVGSTGRKLGIALSRGSTRQETVSSGRRDSEGLHGEATSHAEMLASRRKVRAKDGSEIVQMEIHDSATDEEEEEEGKDKDWKRASIAEKKGKGKVTIPAKKSKKAKGSQKGREEARGAKLPQLPTFTGGEGDKITVMQWIDSYRVTGRLEGWSENCLMRTMCKGLQGDAMEWLAQNEKTVMTDLETFEKALKKRFVEGTKAGKITEMLKIKQEPDETPKALGQRIQALARKANLNPKEGASLMYAAFLEALHPQGRQAVIQQGASTLTKAVTVATRQYEAHLMSRIGKRNEQSGGGVKRKAEGRLESNNIKKGKFKNQTWVNQASSARPREGGRGRRVSPQERGVKNELERLQQQLQDYEARINKRKTITCFACGDQGHIARTCPKVDATKRWTAGPHVNMMTDKGIQKYQESGPVTVKGRVEGYLTKMWLDTGASVSLIRENMRNLLAGDAYLDQRELQLPGGQVACTKGYIDTTVKIAGVSAKVRLLIVVGLGIPVLLGTDSLAKLGVVILFPRQLVTSSKGNIPFWPLSTKDKVNHEEKMNSISLMTLVDSDKDDQIVDIRVKEYPREVLIDEKYFPNVPPCKGNLFNKHTLPYSCVNGVQSDGSTEVSTEKGEGEGQGNETHEEERRKGKEKEGTEPEIEGRIAEEEVNKFLTEIKDKIGKNKRGIIALKGLKPQDQDELILNFYKKINMVDHPEILKQRKEGFGRLIN